MAFKLTLACLIIAAVLTGEAARRPGSYHKRRIPEGNDNPLRNRVKDAEYLWEKFLQRRACIALGGTGCEGNNGKCCRAGDPYTGTMRKCVNTGNFESPVYTCNEQ